MRKRLTELLPIAIALLVLGSIMFALLARPAWTYRIVLDGGATYMVDYPACYARESRVECYEDIHGASPDVVYYEVRVFEKR